MCRIPILQYNPPVGARRLANPVVDDPRSPDVADAITALDQALGDRQAIITALSAIPLTPDLEYVLGLLTHPTTSTRSLVAICRAGHISLGELIDAFKQGLMAQAYLATQQIVAAETPKVVQDVFTRAQTHEVECPSCHGSQQIMEPILADTGLPTGSVRPVACPKCVGVDGLPRGRVTVQPTIAHQRLALDLAKLLPQKGPAVLVDQRQQLGVLTGGTGGSPASLTALVQGFDKLMATGRPTNRRTHTVQEPIAEPVTITEGDIVEADAAAAAADTADPAGLA